jgi:hypothetical protein
MPTTAPVAPPGDGRERVDVVAMAWASYQANRWSGEPARAAGRTNVNEDFQRAADDVPSVVRFAVVLFVVTVAWIAAFAVSFAV